MLKRLTYIIIVVSLFITPTIGFAQDSTPDNQPESVATLEAMVNDIQSAADRAETAAQSAEEAAAFAQETFDRATSATDMAFNLLGLFEAFGLIITIIGVALSAFGFQRLISAQGELTKARDEVQAQLEQSRTDFNQEFTKQRSDLEDLQHRLERAAEQRGEVTERALLAQAYIPLGERQYKAQDYSGAISTYHTALDLDPNNPVIHYRLGYVYTQQGDLEQARHHYQEAMTKAENFAPAMAGLGFVIRRQGEAMDEGIKKKEVMNEAEQLLLRAMELSPKLVDDDGESWWGILGGLYRRRGQINDAIYAYKQATIVTPQSSYGWGNLALLYMKQDKRDDMLETYTEVEKLAAAESAADVNNYWGHADLVVSRYALGKGEEAAEVLERAIQIAPLESPYMLDGLQGTLEDLEKVLEAEKIPAIETAIARIKSVQTERAKLLVERKAQEAKMNTQETKTVTPESS